VGSVLALASCLGERTGYLHATYFLGIEEPTLTILAFSAIALLLLAVSKRVGADHARLALVVAIGLWLLKRGHDDLATSNQAST
jgi:hypothetical protein